MSSETGAPIEGLRLIRATGQMVDQAEDPDLPFKLKVDLRPPEFLSFTFVSLYGGSEEVIVQAPSQEALEEFIRRNELETHPRLRHLKITGPENNILREVTR